MKHRILILLLLVIHYTARTSSLEWEYRFDSPIVSVQGQYSHLQIAGCLSAGQAGTPALPYQNVIQLLPPGHEAVSYSVVFSEPVELILDYPLYPVQPSRPYSDPGSSGFALNSAIYSSKASFPIEAKGRLTTHFLGGYCIAMGTFTPVRYFPFDHKLIVYTRAVVSLQTEDTDKARKAVTGKHTPVFRSSVSRFVQNATFMDEYSYDQGVGTGCQVLILTPQSYVSAFSGLAEVYEQSGMSLSIVSLEDVESGYNGLDLAEKIRNCIIDSYQNCGTEYVILGGDAEILPARGFYCQVQSSSVYEDYSIPSDLYYSALDGNWDTNGNGVWGEIGEDDLLPEVAVARLPFSNLTELNRMLHKSIAYQTSPVPGEFEKPLLAGELLYSNPLSWGADYLDLLIGYRTDNGYTTNGIPEDHEIEKLYERDLGYWSKQDLMERINQGKSFIHHAGHSNWDYAMKLSLNDINNQNFSQVNGVIHNYTLVYTHGCICGAFDYSDCIAEEMLKIDNFAVAGAFNSRYGWFNEGQTEGPSAHLNREFVNALYTDGHTRIGATHMYSRIKTAPWVNAPGQWEEGALRWCFYDCNILGDAALKIWTENITAISDQNRLQMDAFVRCQPVTGRIEFLPSSGYPFTAELYDISGRLILRQMVTDTKNTVIDVQGIENGVYLLVLKTPETVASQKIVIQNQ